MGVIGRDIAQTMDTHVSKCKTDKTKGEKQLNHSLGHIAHNLEMPLQTHPEVFS
jgi:hypothetical protein